MRMSRSGFSLLVGWLTEGVGGEAAGAGEGFSGERGKRGRAAVMRVVNNHLRFDGMLLYFHPCIRSLFTMISVTASNTTSVSPIAWEESTGLLSSLIPQAPGATTSLTNPQGFNTSQGSLKLGPAPISEELRTETEYKLREQATVDTDPGAQYDASNIRPSIQGVISPAEADLPPLPPTFKAIDVSREVQKVRDARKRIRLEPSALTNGDVDSPHNAALRARALPSVCAYTLHDAGEGYVCLRVLAGTLAD